MARKALDTLLLGTHGEIKAGEDIPTTYKDLLGKTHDTDFKRLEEFGCVAPVKRAAAEPEPEPAPEPEPEPEAPKPPKTPKAPKPSK